jgi:hypothetical protein
MLGRQRPGNNDVSQIAFAPQVQVLAWLRDQNQSCLAAVDLLWESDFNA